MTTEFTIDWSRQERTAAAEAVLCCGKTVDQIGAILRACDGRRLLLTRLARSVVDDLPRDLAERLDYDALSQTAIAGPALPVADGRVCIVAAGTSDLAVAREAMRALAFHGEGATIVADVGVAGLWRLLQRIDEIRGHSVIIAVAGMEGALFSVLAGLTDRPIVAVPTSVGYGVGSGGHVALASALAGCAPGLATVNIDNGYGAACIALRILRLTSPAATASAGAA